VQYWIQLGAENLFPSLLGIVASDPIDGYLTSALHEEIAEWAQAARFLYEKIGMYRNLASFREELDKLLVGTDLDALEVILETVDRRPKFTTDLSESLYPMGRMDHAMKTIRSFTGFVRQILTLTGLDVDTRSASARYSVVPGMGNVLRDHSFYLQECLDATPAIAGLAPALRVIAEDIRDSGTLTDANTKTLYKAFNEICKMLGTYLPRKEMAAAQRISEDRRVRDFIAASRTLRTHSDKGYIAVADVVNFENMVAGLSRLLKTDQISVAADMQDVIARHIDELASPRPDVYGWVASDSVIIAARSMQQLLEVVTELLSLIKVAMMDIDRDQGSNALDMFRFGIESFDETPGGVPIFKAMITAYRIGDKHGNPRGYIAMTPGCYQDLHDAQKSQFTRQNDLFVSIARGNAPDPR
jgi:hypothetical protein